jgi:hypothetical protein
MRACRTRPVIRFWYRSINDDSFAIGRRVCPDRFPKESP